MKIQNQPFLWVVNEFFIKLFELLEHLPKECTLAFLWRLIFWIWFSGFNDLWLKFPPSLFLNKWIIMRCFPIFRRKCSGFTLLELLVVMVIIGLLAGYVAPRYFAEVGKSEVKVARAQIEAFDKALDAFRLDTGHYPTAEQGLAVLMVKPSGVSKWAGPYLKKSVPTDPWGSAYQYRYPSTHGRDYDLFSLGKDGKPGGEGEDADIGNW